MTQNKEYKEVNLIDSNLNDSYKTKKNFTGFYTEINPSAILFNNFLVNSFFNKHHLRISRLLSNQKLAPGLG